MLNLDQLFENDQSCKLDRVLWVYIVNADREFDNNFCLHLHDSDELGLVKTFTGTVQYESSCKTKTNGDPRTTGICRSTSTDMCQCNLEGGKWITGKICILTNKLIHLLDNHRLFT
jgi:hypothetical protein